VKSFRINCDDNIC